jgi:tRNA threonylcarbamoyladenosine biosynthesis protein TsaE
MSASADFDTDRGTGSDTDRGPWRACREAELEAVAAALLRLPGERPVYAFYGDLGAGKTACIRALCRLLDVTDTVSSPSFGLVHPYATGPNGPGTVYHLDLYRTKGMQEILDLGLEDMLDSGMPVFIEWAERLDADWWAAEAAHRIAVSIQADGCRRFEQMDGD